MIKTEYPVLCGGIFFTLLLEARVQRTSKRNNANGKTDGLNQTELLVELFKIIKPTFSPPEKKSTFKKNVSGYKMCADNGGTYFSYVLESNDIELFNERMSKEYNQVLSSTSILVKRFIDYDKAEWLIKALFEVIKKDNNIPSNIGFNIQGKIKTKHDLLNDSEICLPSYLLGIWHYIVMKVKDNTIGKNTFINWHLKKGDANSTWVFKSNIGNEMKQKIVILPFSCTANEPIFDNTYKQVTEQNGTYSYKKNTDSSSASKDVLIDKYMMFSQSGNNNIQVGSIDSITINNN